MYEVVIYETPAESSPLQKYLDKLAREHKDDNLTQIRAMIEDLGKYGFELNNRIKNSIKLVGDQIYELRPKPSRIFFFHYFDGKFVLLHGFEKKTQRTPKREIRKAEAEKADFIKRYKK